MATAVPHRLSWINSLNFNYIDNAGRRSLKNSRGESTAKYGGAHGWLWVELLNEDIHADGTIDNLALRAPAGRVIGFMARGGT
jgi:hypothetical protein